MKHGPRVVVTGVGAVTSLGAGARESFGRLARGERAIGVLSLFDGEGYPARVAAEAPMAAAPVDGPSRSRSETLALAAAREALDDASCDPRAVPVDLLIAASTGGMYETERVLTAIAGGRDPAAPRSTLACHPISAPADAVHAALGPFVSTRTVCAACAGGAVAIALAAVRLRLGLSRAVLAGGVDALSRLIFAGFSSLASLDATPCRPFDRARKGLSLGEGSAFFLLEREDDARERGAAVLGEVAGFCVACEAFHITRPEPSGETVVRAMRAALADAGLEPADVSYVSAHGTGTPLNDAMEAAALAEVFGADAAGVAVSSQKGQIGHTLSAAGAVEAAVTLLALEAQVAPPTGGLEAPETAGGLDWVAPVGRRHAMRAALSNSFGFGGLDATLVLTREVGARRPAASPEAVVVTAVAAEGARGRTQGAECARYADVDHSSVSPERRAGDVLAALDVDRSRRFDRATAMMAGMSDDVLRAAGLGSSISIGVVAGSAYGSTEASVAFSSRVESKGPRFASPAEFPNLVPSSAGAHAAIYARLGGPALTVADLSTTPLAALATASELVRDGRADAMVALAVEAESALVEGELAAWCSLRGEGRRGEGGGAVVVETAAAASRRGARALARVVGVEVWRGEFLTLPPWAREPSPGARAEVLTPVLDAACASLLARIGWQGAAVCALGGVLGWHEAVAAQCLSAAVGRLAAGAVDEVLVVASAPGRVGAALLTRP